MKDYITCWMKNIPDLYQSYACKYWWEKGRLFVPVFQNRYCLFFYNNCTKSTKKLKIIRQVTAYSGRQAIKNNSVFLQFFQVIFSSLILSSSIYMKIGSWFFMSLSALFNYSLEVIILISLVIRFSLSLQGSYKVSIG